MKIIKTAFIWMFIFLTMAGSALYGHFVIPQDPAAWIPVIFCGIAAFVTGLVGFLELFTTPTKN